jgi:putative chitinase
MNTKQLFAYRQLALPRFQQLLLSQPEKATEADYFVDQSIRRLSNLPTRPEPALPYVGLYGTKPELDEYREYRDVAVDRLTELVLKLPNLDVIDAEIDQYLRKLSHLPERGATVEPYVRLFVLRSSDAEADDLQSPQGLMTTRQYVTAEQLIQIAGTQRFETRIRALTPGVNATFEKYTINTPLRMAHFLAQVMHESGGFRWLREIWGPTDWQLGYEGREDLGNTQPGDGARFMGRGLIQLTGRANYTAFSKSMEVPNKFVNAPELVESSPWAVLAAGWFWDTHDLNSLADEDGIRRITRGINGGLNGLEDRIRYLDRAKLVLK